MCCHQNWSKRPKYNSLHKRIIEDKVEDEEFNTNSIQVTKVKKMFGVYLSEDAVEELNFFIETVLKSTKEGASTKDCTLKSMEYTMDSVDTKDSIRKWIPWIIMIRRCRRTKCLHRSSNKKHEGRCKYDGQYSKINEIHDGLCRYEGQYQDDE